MAPYRILSLDGGGIRGVLTASLLERLEEKQPGFLTMVDLFAGTSTGGILALALASGMTAEVRDLYVTWAKLYLPTPSLTILKIGQFARRAVQHRSAQKRVRESFW
jgi:patatin-like phospholipase/acyl hydrolase